MVTIANLSTYYAQFATFENRSNINEIRRRCKALKDGCIMLVLDSYLARALGHLAHPYFGKCKYYGMV
jgi:hypothetical protein